MKPYWERYGSTHSLTSALDEGEWLASRPGRFTPREKAPGTHRIGGWVGPRARAWTRTPDHPAHSSALYHWAITAPYVKVHSWARRHEDVLGEWRYSSVHSWRRHYMRWVVCFTSRPLYPQGKSSWCPLDKRLCEPQSRSGHGVKEKNSQPPPEVEPRSSDVQPDWSWSKLMFQMSYHMS
jgi:hypothetical protein